MPLQIVGMHFDKPRQDQIPSAVDGSGRSVVAFGDVGNSIADDVQSSGDYAVLQDKRRIGEAELSGRVGVVLVSQR